MHPHGPVHAHSYRASQVTIDIGIHDLMELEIRRSMIAYDVLFYVPAHVDVTASDQRS